MFWRFPSWLIIGLAACLAAGCCPSSRAMLEDYLEGRQAVEATSQAPIPAQATCPQVLSGWLDESVPVDSDWKGSETIRVLATYSVSGDGITLLELPPVSSKWTTWQQDVSLHQQTWDRLTSIIPAAHREGVTRFLLFSDGPAGALGAVEQSSRPGEWTLAVDIQDAGDLPSLATTLIHETAHLVSLDDAQVEAYLPLFEHPEDATLFEQGDTACTTYFIHEGCSQPESYLNLFFEQFWGGIYGEWSTIRLDRDADSRLRWLADFHDRHADEFVSSYAAFSPEEDLAESFLYFVLGEESTGKPAADGKIRFFRQFPELVTLRQQLRLNLCTLWEP